MINLLIGIAIGAAFSKFWIALYQKASVAFKAKVVEVETDTKDK